MTAQKVKVVPDFKQHKQVLSRNQDAQQDGHDIHPSSVHHLLPVLPCGDLLQDAHGGQVQGAHGDGARDLHGLRVPTLHPFCKRGGEVQFGMTVVKLDRFLTYNSFFSHIKISDEGDGRQNT